MSPEVEFMLRSLVAFQGGCGPLPPDIARRWERGVMLYLGMPGISLDEAMGLRGGQGKRRPWCEAAKQRRAKLLQRHYERHHKAESKHAASKVIADNLALLEAESRPTVATEYVELYEALSGLPVKIPTTKGQVYKYLSFPLKEVL